MTTRSICISAAVLLLALTLTWPAFPGQNNTKRFGSQCTGVEGDRSVLAGLVRNSGGEIHDADGKGQPVDSRL